MANDTLSARQADLIDRASRSLGRLDALLDDCETAIRAANRRHSIRVLERRRMLARSSRGGYLATPRALAALAEYNERQRIKLEAKR